MAPPARECQLCGKPAPLACPGCGAVFYCNEAHGRRHAAQLGHDADECGRWAAAAAPERRQELAGHTGLPWAAATHSLPPCAFLSQLGLHCASVRGDPAAATAWLRECSCGGLGAAPWGAFAPLPRLWPCSSSPAAALPTPVVVSRAELVRQLSGWLGLPAAQAPCLLSSMPPTAMPPTSWAAYYRLRGLPPDSPAALLLDATLTLYSAVLRVHRQLAALQQASGDASQQQACGIVVSPSNPGGSSGGSSGSGELPLGQLPRLLPGGRLVLHLLGPQRELDQWPLLLELGCLLPRQLHIDLHLIGPDVPAALHGRSLHVGPPAGGLCGRPGCSCAAAWQGMGGHASGVAASENEQQQQQQQPAGGISLFCWRGAYHEVAPKLARQRGTPHAVVAPNAGLAAYMSWLPTLQLLLEQLQSPGGGGSSSSPSAADCGQNTRESSNMRAGANAGQAVGVAGPLVCCFTDYNSEAVHRSRQLLDYLLASQAATSSGSGGAGSRGVGPDGRSAQPGSGCAAGGLVVQEGLNPFRKPAAVLATDNALPAASNGFALWLERPVVR